MKDYEIVAYIGCAVLALAAGLVLGLGPLSEKSSSYANGYCTALGGVRLTDETCNVDGAVVGIKR